MNCSSPDIAGDFPNCLFCKDTGYHQQCTNGDGVPEWRFCSACEAGKREREKDPTACEQMNGAMLALEKRVSR